MAKNKKEVLKASKKVIDKAAAAGVSITAMAKVIQRLDHLQKERDGLDSQIEKNTADAKLVWKALRAELKGLENELKGAGKGTKKVPKAAPPSKKAATGAAKATSKVEAPKAPAKAPAKAAAKKSPPKA